MTDQFEDRFNRWLQKMDERNLDFLERSRRITRQWYQSRKYDPSCRPVGEMTDKPRPSWECYKTAQPKRGEMSQLGARDEVMASPKTSPGNPLATTNQPALGLESTHLPTLKQREVLGQQQTSQQQVLRPQLTSQQEQPSPLQQVAKSPRPPQENNQASLPKGAKTCQMGAQEEVMALPKTSPGNPLKATYPPTSVQQPAPELMLIHNSSFSHNLETKNLEQPNLQLETVTQKKFCAPQSRQVAVQLLREEPSMGVKVQQHQMVSQQQEPSLQVAQPVRPQGKEGSCQQDPGMQLPLKRHLQSSSNSASYCRKEEPNQKPGSPQLPQPRLMEESRSPTSISPECPRSAGIATSQQEIKGYHSYVHCQGSHQQPTSYEPKPRSSWSLGYKQQPGHHRIEYGRSMTSGAEHLEQLKSRLHRQPILHHPPLQAASESPHSVSFQPGSFLCNRPSDGDTGESSKSSKDEVNPKDNPAAFYPSERPGVSLTLTSSSVQPTPDISPGQKDPVENATNTKLTTDAVPRVTEYQVSQSNTDAEMALAETSVDQERQRRLEGVVKPVETDRWPLDSQTTDICPVTTSRIGVRHTDHQDAALDGLMGATAEGPRVHSCAVSRLVSQAGKLQKPTKLSPMSQPPQVAFSCLVDNAQGRAILLVSDNDDPETAGAQRQNLKREGEDVCDNCEEHVGDSKSCDDTVDMVPMVQLPYRHCSHKRSLEVPLTLLVPIQNLTPHHHYSLMAFLEAQPATTLSRGSYPTNNSDPHSDRCCMDPINTPECVKVSTVLHAESSHSWSVADEDPPPRASECWRPLITLAYFLDLVKISEPRLQRHNFGDDTSGEKFTIQCEKLLHTPLDYTGRVCYGMQVLSRGHCGVRNRVSPSVTVRMDANTTDTGDEHPRMTTTQLRHQSHHDKLHAEGAEGAEAHFYQAVWLHTRCLFLSNRPKGEGQR